MTSALGKMSVVEQIREKIDAAYMNSPPLQIHESEDNYITGRVNTLEEIRLITQKEHAEIARRLEPILRQACDDALVAHKGIVSLSQIGWIKDLQGIKAELEAELK